MKKLSKILAACLLHGAAFAASYEQKTFLLPHNPVHSQLMEQALFRTHRHTAAFGQNGHVQATGFFGESLNRAVVGRYFGIGNGKNSFKVGAADLVGGGADNSTELDGGYLVHDQANPQLATLTGKVTLLPKQTIYGVNLTYRQSFAGLSGKNFFFQVNAPIVQVKNDLGLKIENDTKVNLGAQGTFGLADFFDGKVNVASPNANAQTALTKGKIAARSLKATGLADLTVQLGYEMLHNEDTHADIYLRGIVPTGNKSTGEYLFEPLVGNNGHYGLGAGVDADMTLWHEADKGRLSLQGSAAYNYIFESTETRMPGIKRRTEDAFKYDHYALVGQPGTGSVAPAANLLTQDFRVRPGSQLELMTGFSFHSQGGVSVNVGYNMNWREAERVYRKATKDFFDDNGVARKAADLSLRVPVAGAAPGDFVGVLGSSAADVALAQAVADQLPAGALGTDIAAARAFAAVGPAFAGAGAGSNAGVGQIIAGGAAPALLASQIAAYQAGAKLFATTGGANDVLTQAGVNAAAAVVSANAARANIANLQNADASDGTFADSIRQESLITHIVGASLGYSFDVVDGYPLMVGLGGQYELPHSTNAGLESYKLFVKAGVSF